MAATATACSIGSPESVEPKTMKTIPPTSSAMRSAQPQPVRL